VNARILEDHDSERSARGEPGPTVTVDLNVTSKEAKVEMH
jgi:hypothetical protein